MALCEQGRKGHFKQKVFYVQDYKGMKEHGTFAVSRVSYSGQIAHHTCLSLPFVKMGIVVVSTQ